MKEKLKNNPWLQAWFYTQSPLVITRPALRETLYCAACLAGGFVLSCGTISGRPLAFALAFLACVGGGIRGLGCLIGLAIGYLTMQPFAEGLQLTSSGILIYVCIYIFGSLWVTKRSWFRCAAAGVMTAGVGGIFLVSRQLTPTVLSEYILTVLTAACLPLSYERLLSKRLRSAGALLAAGTFLVGAVALPAPAGINPGCVAGIALASLAARRADLPAAAAVALCSGAALDAAQGTTVWTLILGLGAAAGAGAGNRSRWLRTGVFLAVSAAGIFLLGIWSRAVWWGLGVGTALGFLLPAGRIVGRERSAVEQSAELVEERLSCGRDIFLRLYRDMGGEQMENRGKNRVFDRAAAQVCRRCSRYSQCWEKGAGETYRMLAPVLPEILQRGEARREDFPEEFADSCRQLDGLVLAVNQELEQIQRDSRSRTRRREERIVVSRFLLHLGNMMESNAELLRKDRTPPREGYRIKLGVAARGRDRSHVSGDRGASLHTEDGRMYVVLCDGVGTGAPAAEESLLAVDTLVALIRAGMPPESAMEMLNGIYILRDSGSFSTLDVLEVNLINGQGVLYKWGAAPSYLKSGGDLRVLGTAAPPPGLGTEQRAEILRLNLWSGDILVLASDGLDQEETRRLIREYTGDNVKTLAASLVDRAAEMGGEDDMTAVAVRVTEART